MKILATKQGTRSIIEYANIIKTLWQEINYYQNIQMKFSENAIMLKKFVKRERMFEFLVRLNVEFDQLQVQVLAKEELPSMNEVIFIIHAEESWKCVMLEPSSIDGSAMVAAK